MAYQRPQGGGFQSRGGAGKPAAAPAAGGKSAPQAGGAEGKSNNKPAFRLALMEKTPDGKTQTVKGEDGKTVYVGAAWTNKFDGFNVKIEEDIPAGSQVRMYPVDEKKS
jgi:hypothetical protein